MSLVVLQYNLEVSRVMLSQFQFQFIKAVAYNQQWITIRTAITERRRKKKGKKEGKRREEKKGSERIVSKVLVTC